jgi:hypothetical protein
MLAAYNGRPAWKFVYTPIKIIGEMGKRTD